MGLAVVAGAALSFIATAFLTEDFPAFYRNNQLLLQQALPLPYL